MTTESPHHSTSLPPEPVRPAAHWGRRLLVAALVLGTVVVGLATLAGFGGRNHWRLDLLCHFRVQYLCALLIAAGGLAWLRRWRWALLAGSLALVNVWSIAPLYFGDSGLKGVPPKLRILSSNVHFLNRDYQALLDLVAEEQPDVIFLMEVTDGWLAALRPLETLYPYHKLLPSQRPDGIAFYSRHPIAQLDLERCPGINLPTLIAELDLPAGRVTFAGTHPASPGSAKLAEARNIQLAMVADWMSARRGPVVLVGDLNTTSWSPYFHDLLRESGLRDSRHGFGVQATWPWLPTLFRIPIDHCLVSPHFGVADRRVGGAIGSDHRPLIIDLVY